MPGPSRDAERTRKALLVAASQVVARDGRATRLDAVAAAAGVSKGGLLHHFPTKEALFLALAQHLIDDFTDSVERHRDEGDQAPGSLARAYVRTAFAADDLTESAREHALLMTALASTPGVSELIQADNDRWRAEFERDGLSPDRVAVIRRAADGVAYAAVFEDGLRDDEIELTRQVLLELTREPGPIR